MLEVRPCLIAMYTGMGDDGLPHMRMRDPQAVAIKRERLLLTHTLRILPPVWGSVF